MLELTLPVQTEFATDGVPFAVNVAGVSESAPAFTVCGPVVAPNIQRARATPFASVRLVAGEISPAPESTVHVTVAPAIGLPSTSTIRAPSESASTCEAGAVWPSPRNAVMVAGAAGETANVLDTASVSPAVVNRKRYAPTRSTESVVKSARPLTAATVVVPPSAAPVGPLSTATVTFPVKLPRRLPN